MIQVETTATVREVHLKDRQIGRTLTIHADETVLEGARKMKQHAVGSLVVVDQRRKVVGIVTERDVVTKVVAGDLGAADTRIADVMTPDVVTCTMAMDLATVSRLMAAHHVRHLPIIQNDVPMGMISSRDILAYRLSEAQAIADTQSRILDHLEREHPELVEWRRDPSGRVVID